jgi:hypothetical protein
MSLDQQCAVTFQAGTQLSTAFLIAGVPQCHIVNHPKLLSCYGAEVALAVVVCAVGLTVRFGRVAQRRGIGWKPVLGR